MPTETERLQSITVAVPADNAGRLFIQALHRLVPTVQGGDAPIFGLPAPDGALPVTRAEAAAVAQPTIIFGMERPIDLAVGSLRLCSTLAVGGDKRPATGGAAAALWTAVTIPSARPLPLVEILPAIEGHVLRVDHLGVNLPARLVARPTWEALIDALARGSTLYRYPTGEDWPFILPSTRDEYADDIRHFPSGREPKFELCYMQDFDHPVVQVDVQTGLTRDELEARFPAPKGLALPGLGDYQRTVYVAHPWAGLVIRLDMRYKGIGSVPVWETGEWLVTVGGRIRPT